MHYSPSPELSSEEEESEKEQASNRDEPREQAEQGGQQLQKPKLKSVLVQSWQGASYRDVVVWANRTREGESERRREEERKEVKAKYWWRKTREGGSPNQKPRQEH